MSHPTLAYLSFLKQTQGVLAAAAGDDPGTAKQAAVGSRLLDHMIVQRNLEPQLRRNGYAQMLELLPDIAGLLDVDPALAALCEKNDPCAFDRFLRCTGTLQRQLVALNTPRANALCKAVIAIEADHSRQFEAAVQAQAAATVAQGRDRAQARNAKAYDENALLAFIRERFPNESAAAIAKSGFISGGFSKYTVGISLSGTRSLPAEIILRGDAGDTFGGASVVDEYRLLKTLYENGVCLPEPLALEDSGKVFGSPFMLVARRPGGIIGGPYTMPPADQAISDDIAARLAAIHRVPVAKLGADIDNAGGLNSTKVLAWLNEGEAAWKPLNMPSPVMEAAFEWLRRHVAVNDQAPQALVHGDFGLHNLLIEGRQVSTILDWEFSHIGNPAYDLGYFYWQAQALSSWDNFLQAYSRAGAVVPSKQQLDYHILFATTRIGVMLCQAIHVFTSGAEPGIAGAAILGGNFYDQSITRIAGALNRVL